MKRNSAGEYEVEIKGVLVVLEKTCCTGRVGVRPLKTPHWNAYRADTSALLMDGCATRAEALAEAERALA